MNYNQKIEEYEVRIANLNSQIQKIDQDVIMFSQQQMEQTKVIEKAKLNIEDFKNRAINSYIHTLTGK